MIPGGGYVAWYRVCDDQLPVKMLTLDVVCWAQVSGEIVGMVVPPLDEADGYLTPTHALVPAHHLVIAHPGDRPVFSFSHYAHYTQGETDEPGETW